MSQSSQKGEGVWETRARAVSHKHLKAESLDNLWEGKLTIDSSGNKPRTKEECMPIPPLLRSMVPENKRHMQGSN